MLSALSAVRRSGIIGARAFSSAAERLQGTVAGFDAKKGWGFIAPADGTEQVFVHHSQIRRSGFRFLNIGEEVSFNVEATDRGRSAVDVADPEGEELPRIQQDRPPMRRDRPYGGGRREGGGGERSYGGGNRRRSDYEDY